MQINAINSTNFGRNFNEQSYIDADFVDAAASNYPKLPPSSADIIELQKKVDKIKQNVRPETLIAGTAVIIAAFKKGKDFVPFFRKTAVTGGEYVAKGATKVADVVVNGAKKLFKKGNSEIYSKASEKITATADKLRDHITDDKTLDKVGDITSKILHSTGEKVYEVNGQKIAVKNANQITDFLAKNKIINKVGLADAATATYIGWHAADGVSDVVENAADQAEIKNEVRSVLLNI